jgi:hypothetical protein
VTKRRILCEKTNFHTMKHQITMPKALGGSKADRQAIVEVDPSGNALIDASELVRITGLDLQMVMEALPEYHRALRLIKMEKQWPVIQAIYAASPQAFDPKEGEEEDEYVVPSSLVRDLLRTNRTPEHALAQMDMSHVQFLIRAQRLAAIPSPVVEAVSVCAACGAQDPRLRCSACKEMACISILYCTKECQLGHWREHKKVCCKKRLAKADADALQQRMRPAQVDATARVELLEAIMTACMATAPAPGAADE